jgi:hypothetical protein
MRISNVIPHLPPMTPIFVCAERVKVMTCSDDKDHMSRIIVQQQKQNRKRKWKNQSFCVWSYPAKKFKKFYPHWV